MKNERHLRFDEIQKLGGKTMRVVDIIKERSDISICTLGNLPWSMPQRGPDGTAGTVVRGG